MSTQPIRSALATAFLLVAVTPVATAADPQFLGPTPYLSFADSPFKPLFPSSFSYFHLDDFETATRTPGYGANAGTLLGPSAQTDSVDWDGPINGSNAATSLIAPPGSINNTGIEGGSWFSNGETGSFTFTFNGAALGGSLPTHVGVVWTDVGNVFIGDAPPGVETGRSFVTIAATGPSLSDDLGNVQFGLEGDGNAGGGTAEDRFYGVINAAGISSITIYTVATSDWEIDHLQYGALNPIPEPEQWLLMALGIGAVALRIRRRKAAA